MPNTSDENTTAIYKLKALETDNMAGAKVLLLMLQKAAFLNKTCFNRFYTTCFHMDLKGIRTNEAGQGSNRHS